MCFTLYLAGKIHLAALQVQQRMASKQRQSEARVIRRRSRRRITLRFSLLVSSISAAVLL